MYFFCSADNLLILIALVINFLLRFKKSLMGSHPIYVWKNVNWTSRHKQRLWNRSLCVSRGSSSLIKLLNVIIMNTNPTRKETNYLTHLASHVHVNHKTDIFSMLLQPDKLNKTNIPLIGKSNVATWLSYNTCQ